MDKIKMENKRNIEKKVNGNELKTNWDNLKFFGIIVGTIVGVNYLIGSLHNKTLNPLKWEYNTIKMCPNESGRDGFHYDLNAKLPSDTARFEDYMQGDK